MTDISVTRTQHHVEDRSWLLGPHGTEPGTTPSVTLDISAFTEGTHYPDGFIPSGMPLGLITDTGLHGPYDDSADDGRQTCVGLLFSSVAVPASGSDPGGAMLVHGFVDASRLPVELDSNGEGDLALIHFA